jgi:superfamily II DNA or RNA helicase
MAYQSTVAFLARPVTGVERLLVVARTGAGKTFTMIQVLDNMFEDRRPKAVIFPNGSVAANFYSELLDFPSKWRDLVRKRLGAKPSIDEVAKLLASSRNSGAPSKLVSFSYARAGGKAFKSIFHKENYDGCVILMDEVHNLVAPGKDMQRFRKQLNLLRDGLSSAKGSMVIGMTATPFVDDFEQGEELLRIIKGREAKNMSDEGFVTFFNEMPRQLYPGVTPDPETSKDLAVVIRVNPPKYSKLSRFDQEIKRKMHNDNKKQLIASGVPDTIIGPKGGKTKNPAFKRYKHDQDAPYIWKEKPEAVMHLPRLVEKGQNFANINEYYTMVGKWNTAGQFKRDQDLAPKVKTLLQYLEKEKQKSLILVERGVGYKAIADMVLNNVYCTGQSNCAGAIYNSKDKAMVKRFNAPSNLEGKELMYIVADAKEFSEGVSFFGVRSIFLVNPPRTYSRYLQQIGRALRACNSHKSLPTEKQTLVIYCLVTETSIDEQVLDKIEKEGTAYRNAMNRFKNVAVDRKILRNFFDATSESRSTTHQVAKVDPVLTEDPETPHPPAVVLPPPLREEAAVEERERTSSKIKINKEKRERTPEEKKKKEEKKKRKEEKKKRKEEKKKRKEEKKKRKEEKKKKGFLTVRSFNPETYF